MSPDEIARAFGFALSQDAPLASIYLYAPVFRLVHQGKPYILKRTQSPLSRAQAVAAWVRMLASQGIPVVVPASGFMENPRCFPDQQGQEQAWVVYPFIEGHVAYTAAAAQILAAGELLGRIHAAGAAYGFDLKTSETIVPIEAEEIASDSARILEIIEGVAPEMVGGARYILETRSRQYLEQARPRLLAQRLPLTACTWDYKASNLIYTVEGPFLIDPDNSARIPRLYDLAIATLLFHNESVGPGRLFTTSEWQIFFAGYSQHIQLSEAERDCWQDILLCAWMDEALWLLQDDEQGWSNPIQSGMLRHLLYGDFADYTITPSARHIG